MAAAAHRSCGFLVCEGRCFGMDGKAGLLANRTQLINGLADDVDDAAEELVAHRHEDGGTYILHNLATLKALGGIHCNSADSVLAEMLCDLENKAVCRAFNLVSTDQSVLTSTETEHDDTEHDAGNTSASQD